MKKKRGYGNTMFPNPLYPVYCCLRIHFICEKTRYLLNVFVTLFIPAISFSSAATKSACISS